MKSCGIHLRAISQEMLKTSILDKHMKIYNLQLQPHLVGTNELKVLTVLTMAVIQELKWREKWCTISANIN